MVSRQVEERSVSKYSIVCRTLGDEFECQPPTTSIREAKTRAAKCAVETETPHVVYKLEQVAEYDDKGKIVK